MKSKLICMLLLLAVLLVGCGTQKIPDVFTVTQDGIELTVDTVNKTITDGTNVYTFRVEFGYNRCTYVVTYPDNSHFSQHMGGILSSTEWSSDYDPQAYIRGETLVKALNTYTQGSNFFAMMPGMLVFMAGIFELMSPQSLWELVGGRRREDPGFTKVALVIGRILGALVAAGGVAILLS